MYNEELIETTSRVNPETGEEIILGAVHTTRTVRKVKNYDEFLMLYCEDLCMFGKLSSLNAVKWLAAFWKYSLMADDKHDVPAPTVFLNVDLKKKICEEFDLKVSSFQRSVEDLLHVGFLTQVTKGQYRLNPKIFWKGDRNLREATLKAEIKYDIEENVEFDKA